MTRGAWYRACQWLACWLAFGLAGCTSTVTRTEVKGDDFFT